MDEGGFGYGLLTLIAFRGAWGHLSRFLGSEQVESIGIGGRLGGGVWGFRVGNWRLGGAFGGNA